VLQVQIAQNSNKQASHAAILHTPSVALKAGGQKMANIFHLSFRQALCMYCSSATGVTGLTLMRTQSDVKAHTGYLKLSKSSLELQEVDAIVIQLQKGCLCLQVCIYIIPVIVNVNKNHILLWIVVCVTVRKRSGINIG